MGKQQMERQLQGQMESTFVWAGVGEDEELVSRKFLGLRP